MLVRPQHTLRWILDTDAHFGVVLIALVEGVTAALRASALHGLYPLPDWIGLHPLVDNVVTYGVGSSPGWAMTSAAIGIYGGVLGVALVNLAAVLLTYVGRIFGGQARFSETRAAVAWSFAPYTLMIVLWLLYVVLAGSGLRLSGFPFGARFPWQGMEPGLAVLLTLDYAVRLWCVVYFVQSVAIAHRIRTLAAGLLVLLLLGPLTAGLIIGQRFGF